MHGRLQCYYPLLSSLSLVTCIGKNKKIHTRIFYSFCYLFSNSHCYQDDSPENRMYVLFTVTCYMCTFWPDKSDFSKRALSFSLLPGMVNELQITFFKSALPGNNCRTTAVSLNCEAFITTP